MSTHRPNTYVLLNTSITTGLYPSSASGAPVSLTEATTGQDVPDWKVRLARGQNASSPYSTKWYKCAQSSHLASGYWKDRKASQYVARKWATSASMAQPFVPADADLSAANAMKRRLANANHQFKAMAPLAELKEARSLVGQVANSATTMLQGMIALKRGNLRDAAAKASDLWLGWNFGVAPTISDANSAINAVGKRMEARHEVLTLSGSAKFKSIVNEAKYADTTCGDIGAWNIYKRVIYEGRVRYSGGFNVTPSSANNYSINEQFGLDFGHIVPALWELTPFSWAVDYFTNMGEYLEDTFTSPAGTTLYLNKSVKATATTIFRFGLTPNWWMTNVTNNNTLDKYEIGIFTRSISPSLPHNHLRFRTLDEIGRNGVSKVLNLASVLMKG